MKKQRKSLPKPPLSIHDYQRMFRVISSVLDSMEAHTAHACIFFTIAGSYLIEEVHKRQAVPMGGAAFYRLNDDSGFTLAFAKQDDESFYASDDGFHCWIECEGVVVDLMAPLFHEAAQEAGYQQSVPRKMFQKSFSRMGEAPGDLQGEGAFFLHRDPVLASRVLKDFTKKASNKDLVDICRHWYRPYPQPMAKEFGIASDDGTQRMAKLSSKEIVGVW